MEQATGEQRPGEVLASISNRVVGLMREAVGKGPTRCKTHWAGDDIVIVVLGGGFLASEQTLYEAGREDQVKANRAAIQEVLEQEMRKIIEEHVGRRVTAFMSTQHQNPDVQLEIFMLEPAER
ncbi:MAG: DUF2294 family protein [Solirubrobacterales bacterium]|nr:DUF2294 family protein [Solirubrobacterales bacterium]